MEQASQTVYVEYSAKGCARLRTYLVQCCKVALSPAVRAVVTASSRV